MNSNGLSLLGIFIVLRVFIVDGDGGFETAEKVFPPNRD